MQQNTITINIKGKQFTTTPHNNRHIGLVEEMGKYNTCYQCEKKDITCTTRKIVEYQLGDGGWDAKGECTKCGRTTIWFDWFDPLSKFDEYRDLTQDMSADEINALFK